MRCAVVRQAELAEQAPRALQNRLGGAARLPIGVDTDDGKLARRAIAIGIRCAHLVIGRGRATACATHFDAMLAGLRHRHLREVADDVRQDIARGVANFIEQLFAHGRGGHQPARAVGLGDDEAAVGPAFSDRIAAVRPVGHGFPIGVQAARALAAAFKDVPGKAAGSESIVVVDRPSEVVHQRAERDGAVDASPRDDNLRARIQRCLDRQCAEIRIRADHLIGQGAAALQFAYSFVAQGGQQRHDVVAFNHRNAHAHAQLIGQRLQRRSASARIHAACVGDDADVLRQRILEHRAHRHAYEVGGIARLGVFHARAGQQRHGQLGQVIEDEEVETARRDQLHRPRNAVAPEAAGAADGNGVLAHVSGPSS